MKYTEDQLMQLQLTDMGAYLRAIAGENVVTSEKAPKKEIKNREKFPKEFGNDYTKVDDIYLKGKKKNKHKHDDYDDEYDDYSGNSFLDLDDDEEEDDEYDGVAAIYSKGNKKIKKQQKKSKKKNDDYYYYDDYIDEFSNSDGPSISDKEITAYKAIRARINRLEEGTLPIDEYETLIKLCAVITKLHTVESETSSQDYYTPWESEDEDEEEDDSPYITVAGSHLGNQEVKETDDEDDTDDDQDDDEDEDDEDDEIVEAPVESVFYTRYDTSFDRMAINSQFISLNIQMDASPIINLRSSTPKSRMLEDLGEAKEFVKKYLLPYMCGHMHPTIVVKRQMFENTAKTNYKYDPTKYVFISRGDYVNCYYIDTEQYENLQNGIVSLASSYEGLSNDDIMSNINLIIMDIISELYRDPSAIGKEEYAAVCTDDRLTSNDRFAKFWRRFYSEKNELNAYPDVRMIEAVEYEEIQTAMFMFVSEWREEDGDNYKDLDGEFSKCKPSEVIANNIAENMAEDGMDDDEVDAILGVTNDGNDVIVEPEPENIESLMNVIPVHE